MGGKKDLLPAASKMSAKERKLVLKVGKAAFSQLSLKLLHRGAVNAAGKTDEEFEKDLIDYIRSGLNSGRFEISLRIDHSDRLLSEARKAYRHQDYELSAVYFATLFEHRLNWLVQQICMKKQIHESSIRQLMRDVNLRAKGTWLLELLDHRPIAPHVLKALNEISEIRNAFIHYKWTDAPGSGEHSRFREQLHARLKKAESSVRYFRRFEEDQLYTGQGKRVRRIAKAREQAFKRAAKSATPTG